MSENYPREIEVDARNENNNNNNNIFKNVINKIRIVNIFKSKKDPSEDVGYGNDGTIKKEDYQIAICQDGKFAVTFDTANLRVKILENTDHRQPRFNKKKEVDSSNQNESNGSVEIDKTIAYFKINDDFSINKYYKTTYKPLPFKETHGVGISNSDDITKENISKKDDKFRWSFDISNMYKKNDTEYFILVSISRVNIDEDMKGTKEKNIKVTKLDYKREYLSSKKFKCSSLSDDCELDVKNNKFYETYDTAVDIQSEPKSENFNAPDDNIPEKTDEIKKGISIYRLDFIKNKEIEVNYVLKAVTCYHSDVISGICKFIDSGEVDKDKSCDTQQRRFIILNFRGIYNFEFSDYCDYFDLNEKFEYPQSVRYELDNWFTRTDDDCDDCGDCMGRLISCIYNKYFLVTQYKNNVQSLEVYNLAKMELETTAKRVENKNKFVKNYYSNIFSVNRLQLCFTRGISIVKLYYMENGLQIASKRFDEIKKIHLLEFIDSDEKLLILGKCPKGVMISLVWDLYNTGKVEISRLDNCPITRLARTSGNILLIEDNGKVSSVLKKVEENLKLKKVDYKMITNNKCHIDFKPVNDTEPWVLSRELKDTIVIAYFLEYYTRHATDYAGWMCTVSKAIPLLFKYNYDDYARKLFYKECFADQDHFSALDPNEIIPEEYRERRNHNIKFRAFRPIIELRTDKYELYYKILNPLIDFRNKMIKRYENFDNNLGKSPLALRVVPLPSFTVNDIPRKKEKYNLKKNLLNIFLFLFIPRWYQIGRVFLLWIEFIFYLRLIPAIGIYIYYVIIIFKAIFPFFLFMSIAIFAFAHTMFILLRNPTNIKIKDTTFSGNATNDSTNETFHIELKSDFDPKSIDNPFSSFYEALMAAYFWIGGDWVQRDEFSYWAVDLFTWIASIILVYVLLNMLIAFMSGVYEKAEIKGRQTSLRLRANHIADYEALHHINFWEPEPEPKNIYYFGQSKNFEEWIKDFESIQIKNILID
ncbi:unnamed protein product [Rhizophagus irregularis]|nr:unnamed protein product [Rhizophagus irregularis]